jgi:hypothetical protein
VCKDSENTTRGTIDSVDNSSEIEADKAAQQLSELIHGQTGAYVSPDRIKYIIRGYWITVSTSAHTIHGSPPPPNKRVEPVKANEVMEWLEKHRPTGWKELVNGLDMTCQSIERERRDSGGYTPTIEDLKKERPNG